MQLVLKDFKKKNNFKVIPGWNRTVKQLYAQSRRDYLTWQNKGKIRDSEEYNRMAESRRQFKKALSTCRQNVENERSNAVQEKFKNKNKLSFWKEMKQQHNKVKTANTIDGKTKDDGITKTFSEKLFAIQDEDDNREEGDFLLRLKEEWKLRRKMKLKLTKDVNKEIE